ncbi:MAG TPA: glycosyltransferase family 4 protein [Verrucomicrobiota bacterium]|nr:glycosyltransferase family 4 protein [Verrucomicrobiota bacterium]HNT13563.1 glycosyltransferase family 4 protein [Verrucomicrobiota bacterium]
MSLKSSSDLPAGERPLTVAWFSFFPVEWLPDAPEEIKRLPRLHPASWQRVLFDQFAADHRLKLHIIILRKQFARDQTFEVRGVTFHLRKVQGGTRAPSFFWLDTWVIRRVLREIKPDVVHAWGTEQGAAIVANRLGYPQVVTIQGLISWYEQVVPVPWMVKLAGRIERASLPNAKTLTTEARFTVNWLQQHYPRVRVEQIEHAPDPVFHQLRRQPSLQPLRLIFVGALDYRKGGDVLLLALDQLRTEFQFELIVVGGLKPDVRELTAGLSQELWSRVQMKSNLTHVEIAAELNQATLAVCASRADVSPNAVKEAVVAGVPVVATAVGGIPDYVIPGRNGVLCQPGRVEELVTALRTAFTDLEFSKGRVNVETLQKMRIYLSPQTMARRFYETYVSVVQKTARG